MNDAAPIDIRFDSLTTMKCAQCGCMMDVAGLPPFTGIECPECGNQDNVPARLGQYLILNLISTGGMGVVYRGIDESLGRPVAIKVMQKSLVTDPQLLEVFRHEAQSAAKLNHPHVAQIYAFGEFDGQPYIAMELVSGERFDRLMEAHKPLPASIILQVILDIAEGLQAASEFGVIHGDIKPENILLDEKLRAKLVDFGIAALASIGPAGGIWGTPYYISPERVRGQKCDVRSDIYSLGATMYHALAGVPPFEGKTPADVVKARLTRQPKPLKIIRKDLSWNISEIVNRMLEVEPSLRYPTYASLIGDLRKALEDLPLERDVAMMTGAARKLQFRKPAAPPPARAPTRGPSIRIKGKQFSAPSARREPADLLKHLGSPTGASRHEPEEPAPAPKPKKKNTGTWIAVISTLGLLAAIGITAAIVTNVKENRAKLYAERKRQYELLQERKKSEKTIKELDKKVSALGAEVARIEPLTVRVKEIVEFVHGEPLDRYEARNKPPAPKAAAAGTSPAPRRQPRPSGEEAADTSEDVSLEKDSSGREAPMGMPTREQMERDRRKRQYRTAPPPPAPAATNAPAAAPAAGPAAAPAPAPAQQPALDPPFTGASSSRSSAPPVIILARKIVKASEEANSMLARAKTMLEESNQAAIDITTEQNTTNAVARTARMTDHVASVDSMKTQVIAMFDEASKVLVEAEKMDRDKKAEIESARQAEESRRKEQERQALIASEQERAKTAAREGRDLIQKMQYEEAVEAATSLVAELQTAEGKAAASIALTRFTRIRDARKYLIGKLNAAPYRWGWDRGRNQFEDILGADENGIKLKTRSVAWADISVPRLTKFLEHYLSVPGELPPSEKAKYYIGLAGICYENSLTEAFEAAKEKALTTSQYAQEEIDSLFPSE